MGLGPEGRLEVEPHLDNPAVRLEFGADVAHVAWGGAELRLDLARARALLGG